tara:strand:- start:2396 stop:2890 length:495 start_codon:yes stop_codon:yes gene_type:complete
MKFISHRGNIDGISSANSLRENSPEYIDRAIKKGFEVEVDIRLTTGYVPPGDFYLGHDSSQYEVSLDWLVERKNKLWLHAKNVDCLRWFLRSSIGWNVFWHQKDDYTITSTGYIWVYPGKLPCYGSIIVMPEKTDYSWSLIRKCDGICSDNIEKYYEEFKASNF